MIIADQEKALLGFDGRNTPLEPRNNSSVAYDTGRRVLDVESWCTTVKDVRTFYEMNREQDELIQVAK
jgi:hypothetical protein